MLRIELKRKADLGLNGSVVVLRQGMNQIPVEAWKQVERQELTRWYVEQGVVVLHLSVPTLEEVIAAGYSVRAAHGIVAERQALAAGKSPAEAAVAAKAAASEVAHVDPSLGAGEQVSLLEERRLSDDVSPTPATEPDSGRGDAPPAPTLPQPERHGKRRRGGR